MLRVETAKEVVSNLEAAIALTSPEPVMPSDPPQDHTEDPWKTFIYLFIYFDKIEKSSFPLASDVVTVICKSTYYKQKMLT